MNADISQLFPWVVIKFGGTSVSNRHCWQNITAIIKSHLAKGKRVLVVCSAPSGVSNLLEKLLQKAIEGDIAEILRVIREKYIALTEQLGIDCRNYLSDQFNKLENLVEGIRLVDEVTPRVQARVMAYGEFLLTHIGSEYLKQQSIQVRWQDVREWLSTEKHPDFRHPDAYLSGRCSSEVDINLQKTLQAVSESVVITQGFIAQNERGETVLLGRGGSDSSATYLAAKIRAECCEIWTDVPGIYTANPKQIPQARLIRRLNYDEAQELALMGAKVLHPKCIAPVSRQKIPLFVRYTPEPERLGTEIFDNEASNISQIKSVLTKHDIILISIETVQMWHQVGFLADVFQCFKKQGISIDLISTSESSVTVSLDKNANSKESHVLDALLAELNYFAKAFVIAPCASVSLVGRNIRAILPQLGSVFSVFKEQKIHLVSQAANDLNLTFVVDEEQAQHLASKLHHLLIEQRHAENAFIF
ncbi:MAG: hypothetical protein A3F10_04415 [Coxiella sp. RIFCSPHIGHO2_12_FULL_42_15]|nr:MAG: hypothetical protein A3F10_04415 [Coxiella sp. RIFCSPHIGHO2_12_FULL_42_15]